MPPRKPASHKVRAYRFCEPVPDIDTILDPDFDEADETCDVPHNRRDEEA